LPIVYKGHILETGYRVDIILEECIIIKLKVVVQLTRRDEAQILPYLKLSGFCLGFW